MPVPPVSVCTYMYVLKKFGQKLQHSFFTVYSTVHGNVEPHYGTVRVKMYMYVRCPTAWR